MTPPSRATLALCLVTTLALAPASAQVAPDAQPRHHHHHHAEGPPAPPSPSPPRGERPPQFLVITYDATPGPNEARDVYAQIAEHMEQASHGTGHITLFLNQQFFMLPHAWRPPRGSRWVGHPETYARYLDPREHNIQAIPFGRDPDEIEARAAVVRDLARRGHEMASHGTRHENGRLWTEDQWRAEFDEYERYMHDVVGLAPPRGFRAPFLAARPPLYTAELEHHMVYDASHAGGADRVWPRRQPNGLWEIGVPLFHFPSIDRTILVFDDSFLLRHLTDADVEPVYMSEFEARYEGSRAPMVIPSHGNYATPAIRLFARVCGRRDVRCVTYAELADYLTAHPELEGRWHDVRLAPVTATATTVTAAPADGATTAPPTVGVATAPIAAGGQ